MQIVNTQGNIFYSIEQSELFPNYSSMLKDAIANLADLTGLYVESENLESLCFNGVNIKGAQFKNCNLSKTQFLNCNAEGVLFDQCTMNGLKVKNSSMQNAHIRSCNFSHASFAKSILNNSLVIDCNLENATFSNSIVENVFFHTSHLARALFEHCSLVGSKYIHTSSTFEWINDVTFSFCNLKSSDLSVLPSLSMLFIFESNIQDATLSNQSFTKIINQNTKVLYAIQSNTVWWGSFRGNLAEFKNEIEGGFPTTNVSQHVEVFVYNELCKVYSYLEQWLCNKP